MLALGLTGALMLLRLRAARTGRPREKLWGLNLGWTVGVLGMY